MNSLEILLDNGKQAVADFEKIKNEVRDLQIVEGLYSAIERKFLKFSPNNSFDPKLAKDSLETLEELHSKEVNEDFAKAANLLNKLLDFWKNQLRDRDSAIETQRLRRFCDEFKKPFEPVVYLALARFYRLLPHSLTSQSKFDYAITRAFLNPRNIYVRELRCERDEIIGQLVILAGDWGIKLPPGISASDEIIQIVSTFDEFVDAAELITSFEELVSSRLFENLREFKISLGEIFYHPLVTTSAIECNVFVGNIFAELLAQEDEKLCHMVANECDFAAVFHDPAPSAVTDSGEILKHLRTGSITENLRFTNASEEDNCST